MHHNGRLFETRLWQQIDCSDFSVCTNLWETSNSGLTGLGLFLLRHSLNASPLWVTAEVLRLRNHNSCELHSFINKSRPTVGSCECGGRPSRCLLVAQQRLLCFFRLMLFFQSIAESDAKVARVSCTARLENFVIVELLKCVAWVQRATAHTHTHCAGASSSLCFYALILFFQHLRLKSDVVQRI